MRTGIILLLAAPALLPAADEPKADLAKKELASLQGTWKLVSIEALGQTAKVPNDLPAFALTIDGSKMRVGADESSDATLALDPTTSPKVLDISYIKDKVTTEAIYELDGDTFKLCLKKGRLAVKERPPDFSTEGKPDVEVRVYKREKPAAPKK